MKSKAAVVACLLLLGAEGASAIRITIKRKVTVPLVVLTAAQLARRAELAMKARNYLSAHKDYSQAAEIAEKTKDDNAPRYWFDAGLAIDLHVETVPEKRARGNFLRQALKSYERSLQLEPAAAWAENNLALIERDLGDVEAASSRLAALVERSRGKENFALYSANLGEIQEKQNRWGEALQSYGNAILAEPDLSVAAASFLRVARAHDVSQVPSLLDALLQRRLTDSAARIATDALRDPAFETVRPALELALIDAAAQHVVQQHRGRAAEVLSIDAGEPVREARDLLRTTEPGALTTTVPSALTTSPSMRRLATALGDELAFAGKSEQAERLYRYGGANTRLVDLYLTNSDRAKLTALARSVDAIPVGLLSYADIAATYDYHRASMVAFGVLGDDTTSREGSAAFHAQKAKDLAGTGKIDVREIERYEQRLKLSLPKPTPSHGRSGFGSYITDLYPKPRADAGPCVPFDGKVEITTGKLGGTILTLTRTKQPFSAGLDPVGSALDEVAAELSEPRRPSQEIPQLAEQQMPREQRVMKIDEAEAMFAETAAAICGKVVLVAKGPRHIRLYDIRKKIEPGRGSLAIPKLWESSNVLTTTTRWELVLHAGPSATSDGRIVFTEGKRIHFAALDRTGKVVVASHYDANEEIREISISKSEVRLDTIFKGELLFDVTNIAEPVMRPTWPQ